MGGERADPEHLGCKVSLVETRCLHGGPTTTYHVPGRDSRGGAGRRQWQDTATGVTFAGTPKPVPQTQDIYCHAVPLGSPGQGWHHAAGGGGWGG